jgi:hypothetical protein
MAFRRAAGMVLMLLVACASTPRVALDHAKRQLSGGEARPALASYDGIAARAGISDDERLEALLGAAHACDRLNDPAGARERLERAVERDVPGKIEAVEFDLAERLRDRDRARALGLYYRAAAGAQKNLSGAFPYRAAMDRILELAIDH